ARTKRQSESKERSRLATVAAVAKAPKQQPVTMVSSACFPNREVFIFIIVPGAATRLNNGFRLLDRREPKERHIMRLDARRVGFAVVADGLLRPHVADVEFPVDRPQRVPVDREIGGPSAGVERAN